jgi:hypothetical protein
VAAGLRDAADQRIADLRREDGELLRGKRPEILGTPERLQERHGSALSSLRREHGGGTAVAADPL